MQYQHLLFSGIGFLAACTGNQNSQSATNKEKSASEERPNIIIMLADDLGYNDLTCYRNAHNTPSPKPPTSKTPNLDKLAEQGMRFTDFYCGAAVSSPSRAALLTGRNAVRVGIYNWIPESSPMHLRDEEITIAELLKEKGYQTGHFGKWHLTNNFDKNPGPLEQGYDYALYTQNNAVPSHHNPVNFILNGEPIGPQEGYASHLVVDETINWLDNNREQDKPFYINVWFHEPHEVCAAPDSLASKHEYNQQYYGCIENMDLAVGRLMKHLEKSGLEKNTLIMFSSDNGSQKKFSNLPLKGKKCLNLEGGVRVPFILKWPGKTPQNKVSNIVAGFIDLLPTIADITGTALPEGKNIDGISIKKAFAGDDTFSRKNAPITFYRYFNDPVGMLREGDWCLVGYHEDFEYTHDIDIPKLAKFKPAEGEKRWSQWGFQKSHMEKIPEIVPSVYKLYNLRKDIGQENDVSEKYPEKTEQMKKKMKMLREEMIEEGGDWYSDN